MPRRFATAARYTVRRGTPNSSATIRTAVFLSIPAAIRCCTRTTSCSSDNGSPTTALPVTSFAVPDIGVATADETGVLSDEEGTPSTTMTNSPRGLCSSQYERSSDSGTALPLFKRLGQFVAQRMLADRPVCPTCREEWAAIGAVPRKRQAFAARGQSPQMLPAMAGSARHKTFKDESVRRQTRIPPTR